MRRPGRIWVGLACTVAFTLAGVAHAGDSLEQQLDRLVLLGYDQPDTALHKLAQLRADMVRSPHALNAALFAQAQIEAMRGSGAAPARALADELRAQASDTGQPALAAQADLVGAMAAETAYQIDTSGALSERALRVLEPACAAASGVPQGCDYRAVWLALNMSERFEDYAGAYARADALRLRALDLAERANDAYRLALTLSARALALTRQNDQVGAHRDLDRAYRLAGSSSNTQARVKMMDAMMADARHQPESGLRAQIEAVALADESGSKRLAAHQRVNLAYYFLKQNRPAEALRAAQQALPVVQAFGDQRIERTLRLNMALAHTALGDIKQAMLEMDKGRSLGESGKAVDREANELRELGEAMSKAGQPQQALTLFHEERALSAKAREVQRESAMKDLRIKYDSQRKQVDLELLQRDQLLQQEALANHALARQAWMAVALLMALSVVLAVVLVKRVREANRRLAVSHALLRAQSERDPLTDLANRRHFMAVMESGQAAHFEGALLMVDIDHFKHVNDRHGHAGGDVVICEVARRINEAVRAHDMVVRWGGEEFLIYASSVPVGQLELLAQRVLLNVSTRPVQLETGELEISVSIGFASFPLQPHRVSLRWEQAANLVDMALYTAKTQGRNRAIGITSVHVHEADRLREIETDFEQARQSGQVELQQILGPKQSTSGSAWGSV